MKKIVVIGGGFAGSFIAKHLENEFDVTLIDTKDYFEFTPSVLRTLVEPQHAKKIQKLHSHYLKKTHLVRDSVVHVTNREVETKKGTKVEYDYLVIASGSRYALPIKEEDIVIATRAKELRKYTKELEKSQKILIIGGGVVGVELAAEIATHYKGKEIIVVQSRETCIDRNPTRAQKYAQEFLSQRGVTIRCNEKVLSNQGKRFFTSLDKEIDADLSFVCTGIKPNSEFLQENFSDSLSKRGHIVVNKNLQVQGHTNIFAAGDITDIKEEKTAQGAQRQAKVVIDNIQAMEKDKELASYSSESKPMIISLGKTHGIFSYKNFVLTGIIPGILKRIVEWKAMQMYS